MNGQVLYPSLSLAFTGKYVESIFKKWSPQILGAISFIYKNLTQIFTQSCIIITDLKKKKSQQQTESKQDLQQQKYWMKCWLF